MRIVVAERDEGAFGFPSPRDSKITRTVRDFWRKLITGLSARVWIIQPSFFGSTKSFRRRTSCFTNPADGVHQLAPHARDLGGENEGGEWE